MQKNKSKTRARFSVYSSAWEYWDRCQWSCP